MQSVEAYAERYLFEMMIFEEMDMRKNTLLSVKTQYANLLVSGCKTVELRKKFPSDIEEGSKLFIYSSSPQQKVIGEVVVERVVELPINELWKTAGYQSLVPWADFCEYYQGKEKGVAIFVKNQKKYETPILLSDLNPSLKRPPQSYCYLPENTAVA